MGKSRQTIITNNLFYPEDTYPEKYMTEAGVEVDGGGMSDHDLKHFQSNINTWVSTEWGKSPDGAMDHIEQIQYIEKMRETTSKPLSRVEKIGRTLKLEDIKVGKKFSFNNNLKAFSRTREATDNYIKKENLDNPSQELIVFKTKGKVKHFNVNKWNTLHEEEQESWVSSGEWIITGVKDITKNHSAKRMYEVEIEVVKDNLKEVHNEPKYGDYSSEEEWLQADRAHRHKWLAMEE